MNPKRITRLILISLFILSVVVRLPNLNRPISRHHEYGTAGVLIHPQIWYEEGGLKHRFCLITTYDNKADKNINNESTISDSGGNYYYTSFPPFAIMFPYFVFSVFNIYPDVLPLEVLNLVLHFICCLFIFQIISLLTKRYYVDRLNVPALIGFTVYLFSPATLWSHANLYGHGIFVQSLFIIGIYIFLRLIVSEGQRLIYYALLGLINLFMIYTEWLGVFFAFSVFIYALVKMRGQEARMVLCIITITSVAALALITWQYSQIAGLGPLMETWKGRYLARSSVKLQVFRLSLEYLPSEVEFPQPVGDKIRYDADNGTLAFKGPMSREERSQLLRLSSDDLYKKAIEEIFRQSQYITSYNYLGSWKNLASNYIVGYLPFLVFLFTIALVNFVLFKGRLMDMFYNDKMAVTALYLCIVPVALHNLAFFNFNVVHDHSAVKSGVLIAILTALFYHRFILDENKPIREGVLRLIFYLMVLGSILQYLVINCHYLKGHDHYKRIGEGIARVAKREETVFIKANFLYSVPEPIAFYAHRNIALWGGEAKAKELLRLNDVERGVIFVLNGDNSGIAKTAYVNK
ncbi:MAG TPA: hypothetical protein ACFYEA_04080 [Candidatus Tripitaka californicus]|uniref:hypothetical protein n=1 Tax=Candidatus Tripitaka californicus TaxID=3367616 RepID=UPI0040269A65|nr:hypothetical protein [Planctomycetota bacterium]